ncbi:TetR family transcriptional regulator [Arthrobacter echini]|uniref:TetR family transcriptional regulator n=1 Tax=Arthrobacter echini TaxID=1529066 RepID=A0A4S5E8H2_9MICC|nr:TetR family transcriptional regulator [Arthrobacter echini]THJ67966.1 TetR family transcriptional regulator [Arthrobacter echini]
MRSDEMDRPRTFTEEARRAQIMRCAIEALAELGFSGSSLAEIARRAGVSKGVVSYYFAGKDELLGQVLFDVYARAGAAIAERIGHANDPAVVIRGYLEANLSFLAENLADIRAVVEIAANARSPDGSLRFAVPGEDPVLAHLQSLLQAGKDTGRFGEVDSRSMAVLIRGAIDTASGRLVGDPAFDLEAYTRQLVDVVDLALRPAT